MKISDLSRKILRQGTDDWVPMAEVASLAHEVFPDASSTALRQAAVAALRELQSAHYVRLGDVSGSGFVAWVQESEEALERVEREWLALGTPRLGDIGWLENTASGREVGLRIAKGRD